ncbi:TPA: ABC transporter permease [Candidatus Poribacteria bacterium]|nr:ABC transporter permease [Candidatus Poribacteria bacterium]
MMLKIALRNTLRQKRRTILTSLAMVVGFTLLSFSIGLSDGSYSFVINMFTRNRLGHIQVHRRGYLDKPSLYATINNYQSVGQIIQNVREVEAWTPRIYSVGLGSVGEKSTAIEVVGIDAVREVMATQFDKKVISGRSLSSIPAKEAILGKGLAEILKANIDQEIMIVSQGADGSIANDIYTVVGLVESGDPLRDRMACYLHIKDAQHEIVVIVSDLSSVSQVTERIKIKLSDSSLAIAPWQEFAKSFYQAMQVDQQGMWIALFIIILVVAVGVLNAVLMSVLERTREYGMLKAVGTKPRQIFWLVLYEVNIIALASVVIGTILALGIPLSTLINYLLAINGIAFPEISYGGMKFQTALYVEMNARSIYIPAITIVVSAMAVSLFPALKAACVTPAKAMRTH